MLAALLAASLLPSAARAAAAPCYLKVDEYVHELLRGEKLAWFDRGADGTVQASEDVVEAIQAGPSMGAGIGRAAAFAAAQDLALYAGELELPASLRVGVAWERHPWDPAPALVLVVMDEQTCIRGTLELEGYSPSSATAPATAARVDVPAPGRPASMALLHENCGMPFDHHMSTRPNVLDPAFEARLKDAGQASQSVGGGISGLRIAGRDVGDEFFDFFPYPRPAEVVLEGATARIELPLYVPPPAPPRTTPARVIVQCRDDGGVDVLYVRGASVQRFSKIPVEIR